jgi:hypothetical protein
MLFLIVSWVIAAISPISGILAIATVTVLHHARLAVHLTIALIALLVVLTPVAAYLDRRRRA